MKPFFPATLLLLTTFLVCPRLLGAQSLPSTPLIPNGIFGDWKSVAGSIVRIDRCGDHVCLSLVQLFDTGGDTTDNHNPDPSLRGRPLCNLRIGSGFTLVDPDHAVDGTLYNPKTGKTYSGSLTASGGLLHLRGYIGISLFGASQTWARPTQPVVPCHAQQ